MPTLGFSMQDQEQNKWCWAATAISTHLFYGGNKWIQQCDLANNELKQTNCCQNGESCHCNRAWLLRKAMDTTGNLSHCSEGPGAWDDIKSAIDHGCPLGIQIAWKNSNAGHCLIVSGYISGNGSQMVVVNDPDPRLSRTIITYAALKERYKGLGAWVYSYFTKS